MIIKYDCETGFIVIDAAELSQEEFQTQKKNNQRKNIQID